MVDPDQPPMTLAKYLSDIGLKPTAGQQQLFEAWGQAGYRLGQQVGSALNKEFGALFSRYRT